MAHEGFDVSGQTRRVLSALLTGVVIPRPVAWVTTVNDDGTPNLAPHSFFNAVSNVPPIVYFVTSQVGDTHDGVKDTLRNVRNRPEFVINIASQSQLEALVTTASRTPPGVDEMEIAGVESAPSAVVAPPRVADSPVSLECTVASIVQVGTGSMVLGEVKYVWFAEGVLKEPLTDLSELKAGGIDGKVVDPVIRLGGAEYATLGEIFSVPVPAWEDLRDGGPGAVRA